MPRRVRVALLLLWLVALVCWEVAGVVIGLAPGPSTLGTTVILILPVLMILVRGPIEPKVRPRFPPAQGVFLCVLFSALALVCVPSAAWEPFSAFFALAALSAAYAVWLHNWRERTVGRAEQRPAAASRARGQRHRYR
jgi:hypothetical protein